ncbi:MAG: T9SS type A sorting domain-containing protein [Chitinophagales bacterium]|nr:T9SS type A sorting domain-containing protein [Chitinophagales bacterium]
MLKFYYFCGILSILFFPIALGAQCVPICINGSVIELDGTDTDGDMIPDLLIEILDASSFVTNQDELEFCGDITYSINYQGDPIDMTMDSLIVSCDQDGITSVVEVSAWQDDILLGTCETYIFVQTALECGQNLQLNCPADTTIDAYIPECLASYHLEIPTFSEACDTSNLVFTFSTIDTSGIIPPGGIDLDSLEAGIHPITIEAISPCDTASCTFDLTVEDGVSLICINGLQVDLLPVDTDLDGQIDNCAASIAASNFLYNSSWYSCDESVTLTAHFVEDGQADPYAGPWLDATCDRDVGIHIINIAAWRDSTLLDYCETYILLQDTTSCCVSLPQEDTSTISGIIETWCGDPVVGMPLYLNGDTTYTDEEGYYSFEVTSGGDYTLAPYYNEHPANGVDTDDLYAYQDIIINGSMSPYQLLAADINNDGGVSTFDAVLLNQFILGINTSIAEPTWMFIPEDYIFPIPSDPWSSTYPEVFNYNNIEEDVVQNFVAVKRGDIDCSANPVFNAPGFATLQGVVFEQNTGAGCNYDAGEPLLEGWIVSATDGVETYYTFSTQDGTYEIEVPAGSYWVVATPLSPVWEACSAVELVQAGADEIYELDLGFYQAQLCPFMEISISSYELQACEEGVYKIKYCNKGSAPAIQANIEISLDESMEIVLGNNLWLASGVDSYIYQLGDVPAGFCGEIDVTVQIDCEAIVGQAHCMEAQVFPNDICATPDPEWDGSILELSAECMGDYVEYTILNTGASMLESRAYIVIEDDLVMKQEDIQLAENESYSFTHPASGTSQRLEMEMAPGPYRMGAPNVSFENCGTGEGAEPSLGYVTAYSQDDGYPYRESYCRVNGSNDFANNKVASPYGIGEMQVINANVPIEYQIEFQNTSGATVNTILIEDYLPEGLDPASIRLGVSSHPYTYSMDGRGRLQFLMENLALPDSDEDYWASKGYVRFYVEQEADLPEGFIIENKAKIHYDFLSSEETNVAWHTIGMPYTTPPTALIEGDIYMAGGGSAVEALVSLYASTGELDTVTTSFYSFEKPTGTGYTLIPSKDDAANGVTTYDLLRIALHITGTFPLDSPYKLIAADINNSGTITTIDVLLLRKRILGIVDETDELPYWRFVLADFVFPDPQNPWLTVFPEVYDISLLEVDEKADFVAIPIGDVNLDGSPLVGNEVDIRNSLSLGFVEEKNSSDMSLYMNTPAAISAYQLSFDLPKGTRVESIHNQLEVGELAYYQEEEQLRVIWYHTEELSISPSSPLFTLEGANLKGLTLTHSHFNRIYSRSGEVYGLQLDDEYELNNTVRIYPNPASDYFTIEGNGQGKMVHLEVVNALGQVVDNYDLGIQEAWKRKISVADWAAGLYQIKVNVEGNISNYWMNVRS